MLDIMILRADTEHSASQRCACAICGVEFELGPVYAWINTHPDEICGRCLAWLCERAQAEGLDVPYKDAYALYVDARRRYTEPISTEAELDALNVEDPEEYDRIMAADAPIFKLGQLRFSQLCCLGPRC
jgi:hypothetical protein